jgi:hypothetical protein
MSRKAIVTVVVVGIFMAGCASCPPQPPPPPGWQPGEGPPGPQPGWGPPGPPTVACKPTGSAVKVAWGVVPECE